MSEITARHALTLWQPWASLVAMGLKHYEFRRWPIYKNQVGKRIVIHAASRKVRPHDLKELLLDKERLYGSTGCTEEKLLEAQAFIQRLHDKTLEPITGAGVAEVTFGEAVLCTDLFRDKMDPDHIDPNMWAWPIHDVMPIEPSIEAKGHQSFWRWPHGPEMKWHERALAKQAAKKAISPEPDDPQTKLL